MMFNHINNFFWWKINYCKFPLPTKHGQYNSSTKVILLLKWQFNDQFPKH